MFRIIPYLRGYVWIKVWGFLTERFMNLCSNHNILLWNIVNCGSYYTMCITVTGFFRLKGIVRKTGTRVAILKRCGLPFFVLKFKKKKNFMAGLIGSFIFLVVMSQFIWTIELEGNYYITKDVFNDFLKEQNIKLGTKSSTVDIEELEKTIRNQYPIVTWTTAKLE